MTHTNFTIEGRPNPPDAILRSEDTYLWIEHADIYRSAEEAREDYSYATPGETPHPHKGIICDPDARTATAAVNTLRAKLTKTSYAKYYEEYGPGILILTERDALFDSSTMDAITEAVLDLIDYDFFSKDRGYFQCAYVGYRSIRGQVFQKIYPPDVQF